MFSEINSDLIKNDSTQEKKRWFRDADNNTDLFVWQNPQNMIVKLQLWDDDVLMEWNGEHGLRTGKVDGQSGAFSNYQSTSFRYHDKLDSATLQNALKLLRADFEPDISSPDLAEIIYQFELLIGKK